MKQEKRTAIIVAEVHVNAHFIRTEHYAVEANFASGSKRLSSTQVSFIFN